MRVALVYDMDGCRRATGVTRHALAQVEQLRRWEGVELRVVSGRISEPDGRVFWRGLGEVRRRELPVRMRWALRFWRVWGWPPVEWWAGEVDWVYCPAEYGVVSKGARVAVTSHDVQQDLRYGGERRRRVLEGVFGRADRVLSVSRYNTERLVEAFPFCEGKVALVPNAADELFFERASEGERLGVRSRLGVPEGMPYLVSVANFQPRKNLERLIRGVGRLAEVVEGRLAVVLIGAGDEEQSRKLREAAAGLGARAVVVFAGYQQGEVLRAAYAEAEALVFASVCESFGIPAVEAMAQGCPVALADSSALPEVGGDAGWYFDPEDEEGIAESVRGLLDREGLRAERVAKGLERAGLYRWEGSAGALVGALRDFPVRELRENVESGE